MLFPSSNAWNLFRSVIPSSCRILVFCFLISNLLCTLLSVFFFFAASFILNSPTRRWWSELMSAPLFTLTSRSTLLHFLVIVMWSVWFSVYKSGDIHVALCGGLCGKRVPPIISSLRVQKSTNRRPFSFICARPSFPIVPFQLSLSFLILAFISPLTTWISLFDSFWMTVWRCW